MERKHTHRSEVVHAMAGIFRRMGRLASGGRYSPPIEIAAGCILLASVVALCISAWWTRVEGNPGSRLASIEALIDHRDWRIDDSIYRYVTVDKVRIDGHFYSSKPPLYPAVGAFVYRLVKTCTRWTMAEHERMVVTGMRILLHIVPFLLGLLVAGRFSAARISDRRVWLWGFLAFAMGTLVFGYSATINNHAPAALLVLASFVGAVTLVEHRNSPGWAWLGTGLVTSAAVALDFGAGVFAICVFGFLVLQRPRLSLVWFVLGASIPVAIHLHLTARITGSMLPFYGHEELYQYPGSYWLNARDFDVLQEPRWVYAFHALVGHHGLFSMTPLFIWSLGGIVGMARTGGQKSQGWLVGLVVVLTLSTYVLFAPRNYGGTAMGMRWFIVLAPLLWYAGVWFADRRIHSKMWRTLYQVTICVGLVHALLALTGPWAVSPWNWLCRLIGLGSVPPYNGLLPN